MSILTDSLPVSISVRGHEVGINSGFQASLSFEEMLILLKKIDTMNNIEKIRSESVSQYNILKEYNYKTIDGCDL